MVQFRLDDESGDRKYFTMVPNFVLNHSSAIDQALYFQMKRYAGEHGYCFASGRTLRKKLQIGQKAYEKSLKYLLEHNWIYFKGKQVVATKGGEQMVNVYGLRDLWRMNNEFYGKETKGVSKRVHHSKGVAESDKGVSNSAKGVAESIPKKNRKKNIIKRVSNETGEGMQTEHRSERMRSLVEIAHGRKYSAPNLLKEESPKQH